MKINHAIEDDFLDNIKPAVRGMSVYQVSGGQTAPIKLNQNESPFDIPSHLKLEILNEFYHENWNRYPNVFPFNAIKHYADFLGVADECVMMGNGSNELIYTIFLAILRRGNSVLIPSPSFSLYEKVAILLEADVLKVAMSDDLNFQVPEIIEEIKRSLPTLVVLSTANNPTARSLSIDEIEEIVSSSRALVLVDEAYHEFSKQQSAVKLLPHYNNLIVLRTFSKAFSMAGIRIGFAISNPVLMRELMKPKIPFATNRLAEIALIKILDNYQFVEKAVQDILLERERVALELKGITGLTIYDSDANFFILSVENPKGVFEGLASKGILIRDVSSYPLMSKCLRVNIGTKEENDQLISSLKDLFSKH